MDKFTKLKIMILAVFLVAAQIPAAYANTALSEGTPYDISIETVSSVAGIESPEITGGTVAAYNSSSEQISSAAAGEQVVLRAYPEVEYVLSYMSSIPDVTLTRIDDTMYSFEMPDEEVLIKAVFEKGNREGTRENPWHIGIEDNPNGIMAYLDGDNVLSIKSGEGVPYVMKDFDTDTSTAPYVYFLKPVKKIDVSEGVPNIGDYAFFNPYGISSLTEINLPDSLTRIGKYAFSGYSSIDRLTIPADVALIGENCFLGDTNLHTIIFEGKPGDFILIDENAFSGITARVYVPSSWLAPDGTFDPSAYQFGGNLTYIVEGTAQIVETGRSYAMVQDAVNDASDGQTIKMNADLTENVTIPENLTVTLDLNGHVLTGTGAGTVITVNSGANLTLTDSSEGKTGTVTGGTGNTNSEGKFFFGCGVYNSGTFNMNSGAISGNAVAFGWGGYGGGVYNSGTFNMTGGSIFNNTLYNVSLGNGGGVYNTGTFNMSGGEIFNNSVVNYTSNGTGGGVYNEGKFNMSGGIISDNIAAAKGGGVYDYSGTFTMTGGKITGNTAANGGGVYWFPERSYYRPDVEFTMTGGEITGNTAASGGGVWFSGTGCTFGGDAKITGNTDGIVGSKAESNLFLANGSIMLDVATGDDAPRIGMLIGVTTTDKPAPGELLAVSTKHIAAEEYFRSDDPAYWFVDVDEKLRLVNAAEDPRVAYVAETGMVYSKVQSAINTIPREKAWTVIMHGDSTENLLIDYRSVPAMTLDLNGHTLRGTGKGSVITIEGGKLTLNDSSSAKSGVITGGNAECGGGVYILGAARLIMTGGTITGNTAAKDGGGVYSDYELRMTGGVITGNSAGENGGGVYNDGGVFVGGDAKIIGNTAGKEGSMTDNNLYLVREEYVAYAAVPDGMRIGVTAARAPTADSPFTITTIRVQAGDEAYFTSDNPDYEVKFNTDHLELMVKTVPETYTVTVTNDGHGTASADKATAIGGETVTLTATPDTGYRFKEWRSENVKTFIDDTFTMPLGPVTVLAKFEPAEAPVITPKDAHVSAGEKATFTIQTPLEGLSYQWYIDRNNGRGWKMLDGATGTSYTTSRTETKHNGYRYKCVAKDTEDYSAESNIAVLHVSSHPIPPTGDNNHPLLWMTLVMGSGIALFCAGRKKQQYR